jgi:hypothetical protein
MNKIHLPHSRVVVPVAITILFCALWVLTLNAVLAHTEPGVLTYIKYTSNIERVPITVVVEKAVPVLTTIQIDRPVVIEKEIEVPRDVPVALKDWDNTEQLAEFLKNDDTDRIIILQADSSGEIAFNGQCEDLAFQLRDRAMAIGRYLSVQVLNPYEYQKWYGTWVGTDVYHAICMARIGNAFWYIEPSNDKYWQALFLD